MLTINKHHNDGTPYLQHLLATSNSSNSLRHYFDQQWNYVKQNRLTIHEYLSELMSVMQGGYTPLLQALKCGNTENLQMYFNALQKAYAKGLEQGVINAQMYFDFLTQANNAGFSPLLQVLKSQNTKNITMYFNELDWAVEQEPSESNTQKYFDLLITPNNSGFTPLHQAVQPGYTENLCIYLHALNQGIQYNYISNLQYAELLMKRNDSGCTALHCALLSKNTNKLILYFNQLDAAFRNQSIDLQQYFYLLSCPNNAGFTPLHEALTSGNMNIVTAYFNALDTVFLNGYNSQAYYALLTDWVETAFTPVYQAVNSDSLEVAVFFLSKLESLLALEDYQFILSNLYCIRNTFVGNQINEMLDNKRRQFTPIHPFNMLNNLFSQEYLPQQDSRSDFETADVSWPRPF